MSFGLWCCIWTRRRRRYRRRWTVSLCIVTACSGVVFVCNTVMLIVSKFLYAFCQYFKKGKRIQISRIDITVVGEMFCMHVWTRFMENHIHSCSRMRIIHPMHQWIRDFFVHWLLGLWIMHYPVRVRLRLSVGDEMCVQTNQLSANDKAIICDQSAFFDHIKCRLQLQRKVQLERLHVYSGIFG